METWWPLRLPQRMLYLATLAMVPMQFAVLFAELALALVVASAIALAVAIYAHALTDSVTAGILSDAGRRVTEILKAQGVY